MVYKSIGDLATEVPHAFAALLVENIDRLHRELVRAVPSEQGVQHECK